MWNSPQRIFKPCKIYLRVIVISWDVQVSSKSIPFNLRSDNQRLVKLPYLLNSLVLQVVVGATAVLQVSDSFPRSD